MPRRAFRQTAANRTLGDLKRELACGYRILGHHGLGKGLLAHLTARSPGGETFWTYQLGQSVEEVRMRDLCESDFEAAPLRRGRKVNPTLRMHGFVYRARPDVQCICHHHGDNSVAMGAVSALLRPFDRSAARWQRNLDIIEDYDNAHRIADQGAAIVRRLGRKKALILKFHGVLVTGASVRDAVVSTIDLERSFGVQLKAMAAGRLSVMPKGEIEDAKKLFLSDLYIDGTWRYLLRALARDGLADIG